MMEFFKKIYYLLAVYFFAKSCIIHVWKDSKHTPAVDDCLWNEQKQKVCALPDDDNWATHLILQQQVPSVLIQHLKSDEQ